MELEIKRVGDKLRTLRKELGLKQEDLVKHKVNTSTKETPFTRNLVSMVETDKSTLTKKMAETIHKNMLIACDERDIKADFDFEEVCITPEEQTIRYINNYRNNLCKVLSLEESINYGEKLLKLGERYRLLDEICKLYINLGDLTSKESVEKSIKYYSYAYVLKSELSPEESLSLSRKLKAANMKAEDYEAAINVSFDKSANDKELVIRCMSNDILSLKKLSRFDEALKKISEIKLILDKNHMDIKVKIEIIEANIHLLLNNYSTALHMYKKLRVKKCSDEDKFLIEYNMIRLKIETDIFDLEDIETFIENKPSDNLNSSNLTKFYDTLYLGYSKINNKKSIGYLIKGLRHITTQSEVSKTNKEFFNVFINELLDNHQKLTLFLENSKEDFKLILISSIKRNIIDEKTLFKSLHHFQDKNDYNFVNSLIQKKIA